jgi:hypothetical protein
MFDRLTYHHTCSWQLINIPMFVVITVLSRYMILIIICIYIYHHQHNKIIVMNCNILSFLCIYIFKCHYVLIYKFIYLFMY